MTNHKNLILVSLGLFSGCFMQASEINLSDRYKLRAGYANSAGALDFFEFNFVPSEMSWPAIQKYVETQLSYQEGTAQLKSNGAALFEEKVGMLSLKDLNLLATNRESLCWEGVPQPAYTITPLPVPKKFKSR